MSAPKPTSPRGEWLDAWHVDPSANKEYELIDGLRGIAILLVVLGHFAYTNPHSAWPVKLIVGMFDGAYGVALFFTLSGFLISWPFWKRKMKGSPQAIPPGYGWRRFYKIYPPLALTILLFTPIYIFRLGDPSIALVAMQWLAGLPVFLPVKSVINPVMWSLTVEVQFYLLLPLLFLAVKKLPMKAALGAVFLILFLGGTGFFWLYTALGLPSTLQPVIWFRFPAWMDSFALGVLLAGLDNYWGGLPRGWAKWGDAGAVLLVLVLAISSGLILQGNGIGEGEFVVLRLATQIASVLLLCYVADPQHPRARLLCLPWLRWCGIISYEWYLFHQPLALWSKSSFGSAHGDLLNHVVISGFPFVAGLGLAALTYRYFSLPILKAGRTKHRALKKSPSS